MNPNYVFLNSHFGVTEDTFKLLQGISRFKELKKHDTVAKVGEVPSKIYMLTSGIMRVYMNAESGKEHNKNIFSPISFVGALTALIKNEPSKLTYEALTDCKLIELDFADLMHLCNTNLKISRLYNRVLEAVFTSYEKRQLELLSLDATQRYFKLRERIPNIDKLIPQYQIASYLNITAVQLSRIRKQLE